MSEAQRFWLAIGFVGSVLMLLWPPWIEWGYDTVWQRSPLNVHGIDWILLAYQAGILWLVVAANFIAAYRKTPGKVGD